MIRESLIPNGDTMSNIKITPTGREYATSSKADWTTWKFCLSLHIDELQAYIGILKKRMKELDDDKEILNNRRRISIANDTYNIKQRNPNIEDFDEVILDDIKLTSANILSQLGYQNTDIYYQEINSIIDCLKEEKVILKECKYDEYVYATVLVSEILDYYHAKYEEDYLASIFDISVEDYQNLKIILNKWLTGNYWLH